MVFDPMYVYIYTYNLTLWEMTLAETDHPDASDWALRRMRGKATAVSPLPFPRLAERRARKGTY